jgi:hypothetical protein
MALLPQLTDHLASRLEIEFAERDGPYSDELDKTTGEHNARGMLGSGAFVQAVLDKGRIELKARAQLILSHFFRSAAVFGTRFEMGISTAANELLQPILAAQRLHVRSTAESRANKSGVFSPRLLKPFDDAADRETIRLESELQLWEAQLRERKSENSSNVVNVTGSFNVVQAGTFGSTASIVIDADSRQALLEALSILKGALPSTTEIDEVQKRALGQVIDDCETEIQKETPNRSRLMGYLQTITTVAQAAASLQPAWEAIRRALQLLGFIV